MLSTVNVSALKKAGVTDLFISTNKDDVEGTLVPFIKAFSGSGIRIHAWITCFKSNGSWFNPATDTASVNKLYNSIISIATKYNISGIHLDAVRYPGTYKLPSNGTASVTAFVKKVYLAIQNINSKKISGKNQILVSAALMPEYGAASSYGQDYSQLANYLDFLVPMVYKGNYLEDSNWIGSFTQWAVAKANGTPVVVGLQTYRSDSYPIPIPAAELKIDEQKAINNGSSGYVLFKYGLTDTTVSGIPYYSTVYQNSIITAAASVKIYIEKYQKLPSKITVGTKSVDMPTFLYLLCKSVVYVKNGTTSSTVRVIDYNNPSNTSISVKTGTLLKAEYVNLASTILSYMNSKGSAPNYIGSSLGNIPYRNLVYVYSKILNYYKGNSTLPSNVSISTLIWPKITSTNPTSNATKVSRTSAIIITFNNNISAGSSYSGIYVKNTSSGAKLTIAKSISGNILTIKTSPRSSNTTYLVYIPTGAVKNAYGNQLITSYSYKFTTISNDKTPPTIIKTSPTKNATGVSLTSSIIVTFSEKIVAGAKYSGIYIKNLTTGKIVSISKHISGNVLTIKMTQSRLHRNYYQVYIPASAVKDSSGNSLVSYYSFKFRTG